MTHALTLPLAAAGDKPDPTTKRCTECGEAKPLGAFSRRRGSRDGRQAQCRACKAGYGRTYYAANAGRFQDKQRTWRAANVERHREHGRAYHATHPARGLWAAARKRAREKGLAFTITPADITIPARCPVLGIPLERGMRKFHDNSPSLDQIIAGGGYTPDNVQVVSYRANTLKSNGHSGGAAGRRRGSMVLRRPRRWSGLEAVMDQTSD